MAIYALARQVYRKYAVDNIPSSGPHDPRKDDIMSLFAAIDSAISTIFEGLGASIYAATKADLDDVAGESAEGDIGIVLFDSNLANRGVYELESGVWNKKADLPADRAEAAAQATEELYEELVGAGAGTPLDNSVTDEKIASPSRLSNRIQTKPSILDFDLSTPDTAANRTGKLMSACAAFAAGSSLGPFDLPAGLMVLGETVAMPANIRLGGAGQHSDLREYGDTTGGVAHPLRGTTIVTDAGSVTAQRWTDVSDAAGTLVDSAIKPALVFLGDNIGLRDLTLYTSPVLADALDTGIHIAGTGRHRLYNVDVRGGWKKGALYFDATWGINNDTLLDMAHLPAWFDADAKAIYDYGLTDIKARDCRFYGVRAVTVQGTKRSSPSTWVWAPNGISDSALIDCALYNEGNQALRESEGALIYFDYRVAASINAQGFAVRASRLDSAAKWVAYLDHCDDISISADRSFTETSEAWFTLTGQRGVIETTANTGDVRLQGEIYANLRPVGGAEVNIRDHRYRNEGGRRIRSELNNSNTRGSISTPILFAYGADSGKATDLQSWAENGLITFTSMYGNAIDQIASFSAVATLLKSLTTDVTASGANVNVNPANGNLRQVTSSPMFKDHVEDADVEISRKIVYGLRAIWYRSNAAGDDPTQSWWGFLADEVAALDPRLVHWKTTDISVENFVAMERMGEEVSRWEVSFGSGEVLVKVDGDWCELVSAKNGALASFRYVKDHLEKDFPGFSADGDMTLNLRRETIQTPISPPIPHGVDYSRFVVHVVNVLQDEARRQAKAASDFASALAELASRVSALEASHS